MTEREQLEQAIAALEAQRAVLGDAVTEIALAPLREKLSALASPGVEPQRKLMTVLFADVSGFTAMSETMDAEDVTDTMNALWTRLDGAIKTHGGHIDKHIGDAVMALFGTRTSGEDDPERAVRAALAMQSELAAFRDAKRVALAMRIGVNTGPVLYGQVGTVGEVTAMGDTVNLASRLEHAAPVGGILISHDTFRHVRGVFDVQPLDPISVKGKSEPVRVYVVQRARPRAFRVATRGVEGVETRMIGRDSELKRLQDAFREVTADGKTRIVTIIGDAGVGKSRLLYEFDNWIDLLPERIRYFKGRALPGLMRSPYSLLRSLLASRFEIYETDSAAIVREKLERGFSEFLTIEESAIPVQEKAHFVGHLVGFDLAGSPYLQGGNVVAVAQFYLMQFFSAAGQQPTVVFLEDIHWADEPTLDFMTRLAREQPRLKLLIVGLTRPELFERKPDWSASDSRLNLQPLSPDDSRRLVENILQKVNDLPNDLIRLVVHRAEGNPFYAEELVKMLVDDAVIVPGGERWRADLTRLSQVRMPPTLTGVLQARLDNLPKKERMLLQRASVVGRIFWDDAVVRLQAEADPLVADSDQDFTRLRHRELIYDRQPSAFAGSNEYVFKHAILRDVTYETVLKRLRRVYHAQVAAWLVEHSGNRVKEYAAVIAEHYEQAQDNRKAAEYLREAVERALAVSTFREALVLAERALELVDEGTPARAPLLNLAGEAHIGLSEYPQASARYGASLDLARRLSDQTGEAAALLGQGAVAANLGEYDAAQTAYEQSLVIHRTTGDRYGIARGLSGLGRVSAAKGEYRAARDYIEESLMIQRDIGDQKGIAQSLNNLGTIATFQGEYRLAQELHLESLAIRQSIGDRYDAAESLNNLGAVAFNQREFGAARAYFEQSLAIRQGIGDQYGIASGLNNLGAVVYSQGDYQATRKYLEEANSIIQQIGDRLSLASNLYNLGEILFALGEVEQAGNRLYEGLRVAQAIGAQTVILKGVMNIANFRAKAGRVEEAVELVSLVERHPATEQADRDQIKILLDEFRTALPPDVFQTALERGKALNLDTVVAKILAEA